jgi:hypothetical protein
LGCTRPSGTICSRRCCPQRVNTKFAIESGANLALSIWGSHPRGY